jgi:hypothetical protein
MSTLAILPSIIQIQHEVKMNNKSKRIETVRKGKQEEKKIHP